MRAIVAPPHSPLPPPRRRQSNTNSDGIIQVIHPQQRAVERHRLHRCPFARMAGLSIQPRTLLLPGRSTCRLPLHLACWSQVSLSTHSSYPPAETEETRRRLSTSTVRALGAVMGAEWPRRCDTDGAETSPEDLMSHYSLFAHSPLAVRPILRHRYIITLTTAYSTSLVEP